MRLWGNHLFLVGRDISIDHLLLLRLLFSSIARIEEHILLLKKTTSWRVLCAGNGCLRVSARLQTWLLIRNFEFLELLLNRDITVWWRGFLHLLLLSILLWFLLMNQIDLFTLNLDSSNRFVCSWCCLTRLVISSSTFLLHAYVLLLLTWVSTGLDSWGLHSIIICLDTIVRDIFVIFVLISIRLRRQNEIYRRHIYLCLCSIGILL